jgi:hypothetical protein
MIRKGLVFVLCLLLFGPAVSAYGQDGRIFTLWPVVDYRHSEQAHYTSLHLFGPIFKYEKKNSEREIALRPLFSMARDPSENISSSDFLYPVASQKSEPGRTFFQGIHLLNYDFGKEEKENPNEFNLFPLVFYGQTKERGNYFALFPLGGKIYDKFGMDEIRFVLFPLYARTQKKDTTKTYVLWPVFSRIQGEGESGFNVWPLFGASRKEGVYRKRFFLWPIFFSYDLKLNTSNPRHLKAIFPLYVAEDSADLTSRTYLWPFFSHIDNRKKNYEEWNFPWPIFGISHGQGKEGVKFLPLFSDERNGAFRKRWFLWPLYKIEEMHTDVLDRRRDRVLFFLYSDWKETIRDDVDGSKRRIALWPLFTYERNRGVSSFYTLSLLEPFFPRNEGIERNWAPLWRIYQRKWDRRGNEISSLFWNLYWKERQGQNLAMELFPLFFYKHVKGRSTAFTFLKGLFEYHASPDKASINLFYLPWGFNWNRGNKSPGFSGNSNNA